MHNQGLISSLMKIPIMGYLSTYHDGYHLSKQNMRGEGYVSFVGALNNCPILPNKIPYTLK